MSAGTIVRGGGRRAALLLVAAGCITLLNNYLPGWEHLNRAVLTGIGAAAIAAGMLAWIAPWDRWHPSWSLVLAPFALTLISIANYFGGVSAYSYAVYFVLVFVWIGIAHAPGTSFVVAPVAVAAYVVPFLLGAPAETNALASTTVAIPVCLLVGETVARVMRRLHQAQLESERRACLLVTVAGAARSVSVLDPDRVLGSVVDAAVRLGFDAAEICQFDDAGAYRVTHAHGLPDEYRRSVQPAGTGLAAFVRDRGETIVLDDYSAFEGGVPSIRDAGFRYVVASPIWSDGGVQATLIVGTRSVRGPGEHAESLELLSAIAGVALENARRFEAERAALERLGELDRLKDDFISTASHELRTPLTVIGGMGVTLAHQWSRLKEGERLELLEAINKNAGRLEAIVTSLLDFSRLREQMHVERRGVPLRRLVDEAVSRLAGLLREHAIVVDISDEIVVSSDSAMLDRVLENLLSNAAKHTPSGTRVVASARADVATATVTVSDDGPGVAAEDLPRLGERFFRGGAARDRAVPGTGLGLALVREALALHGSELRVESLRGEGTRFSFSLPLAAAGSEHTMDARVS